MIHYLLQAHSLGFGQLILGVFTSAELARQAAQAFFDLHGITDELWWDDWTYQNVQTGYRGSTPDDQENDSFFKLQPIEVDKLYKRYPYE